MVNLYYNYYQCGHTERQAELDACLLKLMLNDEIDNILVVLKKCDVQYFNILAENFKNKVTQIYLEDRPTFKFAVYNVLNPNSSPDDINIMINSDCFIGEETDWEFIQYMNDQSVYCMSRYDLLSIDPIQIDTTSLLPAEWSQDAWIFKGKLKEGVVCDFPFGKLACDAAFAYNLQTKKYSVSSPCSNVKILHWHKTGIRTYSQKDRVRNMVKLFYMKEPKDMLNENIPIN